MKCISRSTLGVVIGTINLLVYIGSTICIILSLVALNTIIKDGNIKDFSNKKDTNDVFNTWYNDDDEFSLTPNEKKNAVIALSNTLLIFILVVCVIMTVISALLIVGIVKRRDSLMAPWLILSAFCFACSCLKTIWGLFGGPSSGIPFGRVFMEFIANCLLIGIEALILYPIYTLYKDISAKNNERPGQVISAREVGFTNAYTGQLNDYTPVSQKV